MEIGLSSLYLMGKPFKSLLESITLHEVRLWEVVDENSLKLDEHRIQSLLELKKRRNPVSYTHLTLPTKRIV